MTQEKFEHLIEGATESQKLEFKAPCEWNVERFAKDILALSNVRDGGYIIIGISQTEKGFDMKGVSEEQKKTFNVEIMKDQISEFADPFVDFEVEFPKDKKGNEYVLIIVKEFRDIPVICKKNSKETKKGVIYYRNVHRRPESAPIANSYDMKQLIELAAIKMMRRWRELGLMVPQIDQEKFDQELGEIEKEEIIKKITSRGYWKIVFRPLTYKIRLERLLECKEIVERNEVTLRGWYYPHFPSQEKLLPANNFYQGMNDWEGHIDFWRMYQSGQFIHYRALSADWTEENSLISPKYKIPSMELISVLDTIYFITEVFEFLSRLTKIGLYKEGVDVTIKLKNIKDRKLYLEDISLTPFSRPYKTAATQIVFKQIFQEKHILEKPSELALKVILYIFDRFGWSASEDVIREHQKKLLERRL